VVVVSAIEPETFAPENAPEDNDEARAHYAIGGTNEASWALRKLAQARRQVIDNQDLYAAEVARLDAWLEDANKGPERDATYFESILRNWHEQQLHEDPKRKTISLPGGKLKAAQNPESIEVYDPETFIPWAIVHWPEGVRTKHEPNKAEIKKAKGVVAETGEIAPGVSVIPGDLRWKAETE
jgi:phage host-nuclease inhibitor protein Gam